MKLSQNIAGCDTLGHIGLRRVVSLVFALALISVPVSQFSKSYSLSTPFTAFDFLRSVSTTRVHCPSARELGRELG